MRIAGIVREVACIQSFVLLSSLLRLFFVSSVVTEDLSGLLLDPLVLQITENMLLFSNKALIGEGEVKDGFPNVFLGLFELHLGAIQGIPSAIETSFHLFQVRFHVIKLFPITEPGSKVVVVIEGV
jgi:hypothetical protein